MPVLFRQANLRLGDGDVIYFHQHRPRVKGRDRNSHLAFAQVTIFHGANFNSIDAEGQAITLANDGVVISVLSDAQVLHPAVVEQNELIPGGIVAVNLVQTAILDVELVPTSIVGAADQGDGIVVVPQVLGAGIHAHIGVYVGVVGEVEPNILAIKIKDQHVVIGVEVEIGGIAAHQAIGPIVR